MKKTISIALCLVLSLAMFAGCVGAGGDSDGSRIDLSAITPGDQPTETADSRDAHGDTDGADNPAQGGDPAPNTANPTDSGPVLSPSPSGDPGAGPGSTDNEPLPPGMEEAELLYATEGRIAADMAVWSYELYGTDPDGYGGYERMWLIIRDESGHIVDSIESLTEGGARVDPNIVLADANFDGYMDVMYSEGAIGAHGNYWYHLLNWYPGQNQYMQTEGFDQICNPVIDGEDRLVRSLGAVSESEYLFAIFRHENGAYLPDMELFVLYEEEGGENGSDIYTFSLFYYENNVRMPGSVYSTTEPPDGPGYTPDEEELFGPDSLWKLNDPIWSESRHFT